MDQQEKELLNITLNLVKENNEMLHKVRGVQKRQFVFSVLKIVIIVGIALGAFYFLQPLIDQVGKFIQSTGVNIDQLKNLGNTLQNLPR
jgi:ABC-type uncharacterized transport system permease subunit